MGSIPKIHIGIPFPDSNFSYPGNASFEGLSKGWSAGANMTNVFYGLHPYDTSREIPISGLWAADPSGTGRSQQIRWPGSSTHGALFPEDGFWSPPSDFGFIPWMGSAPSTAEDLIFATKYRAVIGNDPNAYIYLFLQQYDHNGDYLTGSDIGLRIYKYADNALSWTFDRVEIANCAFNIAAKSLRLCGVISSQSGAGSNYFAMDNFGLGFGKDEFLPTDPYELDEYPGSKDFDAGYNQEAFLDSAIDGEPIEYNL
ncbi:MAG: hypothetical protein KJ927_14670, partial [Candidatus Eisenbacteria bacterium]|nr:hypothetical protein [Candidatus Eisenbacteria bacterium]